MRLSEYCALTFDVYGTLIDWETGLVEALAPLTKRLPQSLTRDQILEAHARHEHVQQQYTPAKLYRDLLPIIYRRIAEEWGLAVTVEECVAFGRSIADWPAFTDSANALAYLKRHYKLFILSNVDQASLEHSRKKLGVDFDGVFTAEDVGSYKPAARNFEYMLEKMEILGIQKHEILHTAESLFHDHAPANHFGLASCHIYRRHAQRGFGATREPESLPSFQFRFNSMAEMAEAHRAEIGE